MVLTRIEFTPGRRLRVERLPLGDVCLHALARRFERGADRCHSAVLDDMFALPEGYPDCVAAGRNFAVPVPAGGAWAVERVRYRGRPFLTARTFRCAGR